MPYAGDQGKLTFRRTTVEQGVDPPAPEPLRDEFELLEKTSPSKLVTDAMAFLQGYGVAAPVCGLGSDAPLILLGKPRVVGRGGNRLVVSSVLNTEVKGWGWLRSVPSGSDNGPFTDQSTAQGFYSGGHPLADQVFVHSEDDGKDFYDYLTACVVDYGILFNTHSKSYGQSVYHEILHTFEGKNLSGSTVLKEGFVERYADLFMKGKYGLGLPLYPAYELYVSEVDKLIRFASNGLRACAKAYFGDDLESLKEFVACCYKPTRDKQVPAMDRINDTTLMQMAGLQKVRDLLSPFSMKQKGSWYRKWVADHGGTVPTGGVPLPN